MRINNKYMTDNCKIGQGNKCCRYLTVGPSGFECEKLSALKHTIDTRVKTGDFNAQGDNCDGIDNKQE